MRLLLPVVMLVLLLPAHGAAAASPEAVVRAVVSETLDVLANESERLEGDRGRVIDLLETRLLPHVDIPRMARFALGPHWRDATPAQRQSFTAAFRAQVVRTLAAGVRDHAEELARISRSLQISYRELSRREQRAALRATLRSPRFGTLHVDLLLHAEDGPWKVYDLRLAGVSILLNYRSEIAAIVNREGLDGLIARME